MLANTPDNWLFGISPLSFGAVGAVINFAVAYAVMSVTREPPKENPGAGLLDPRAARGCGCDRPLTGSMRAG